MAEEQTAHDQEQKPPVMHPQVQYIKDLSFECPNSPDVFLRMAQEKAKPNINVSHDVHVGRLGEGNNYEVALTFHVECIDTEAKSNMFLLELSYAAVFTLEAPENLEQIMLFVEAPRFLFPYARQIISTTISESGFPPVFLPSVDFMEAFRQKVARVQEEQNHSHEGDGNNS